MLLLLLLLLLTPFDKAMEVWFVPWTLCTLNEAVPLVEETRGTKMVLARTKLGTWLAA